MRIDYAQKFCDLCRTTGSMAALVASVLTGQAGGEIATAIRFRIASLLFSVADTLLVMPMTFISPQIINNENTDVTNLDQGNDNMHAAALSATYQELFRDMFSGDQSAVVTSTATLAGSLVANGIVLNVKFSCIYACNFMDGVQKFVFANNHDVPGSEIIPTMEDFIDVIIKLLDETYTNLIIMVGNMIAGFMGLVTGGPPSIGEWLGNALEVIGQIAEMLDAHAFHFISIIISLTPHPVRDILKALMSTLCKGILVPLDVIADGINHIPFVGSIFPNPFGTLVKQCLEPEDLGYEIDRSDAGNRDFNRRLLESVEHWEGNTFCAHYGRANHTHDEHYDQCVRNRHFVRQLRHVTQKDYFPWTLMDDWKQPAYFLMQVAHGIVLYFSVGEAKMMQWSRAGYPIQASLDIVRMLKSLKLPQASLTGAASIVARVYPDFALNNHSTGYHLMHVLRAMNQSKFPDLRNLHWSEFHDAAYDAVVSVATHSVFPPEQESAQPAQTVSRGLYAAVVHAQTESQQKVVKHLKCDKDDEGVCIHCGFLQKFVTGFKQVSSATADYYNNVYPKQVKHFVNVLSYAERPGTLENTKTFRFVQTQQYADNNALPFDEPLPQKTYQSHDVQGWPSSDDWKAFVIPRQNINDDVPFFGHTLWYYLQYPLQPCKTYEMAYVSCDKPHYSMSDATTMTVQMAMALEVMLWMMPFSLPFVFKTAVYATSFMIFRYDYVPRCLPVLPWCLVMDWQRLLNNIFPPHLCDSCQRW